ncbi:MAG: Crp/Fnr family transcriptional regulator [Bacteroidota bacterium]
MSENTGIWYFESVDLFNILCPHKVKTIPDKHHFNDFKKDQYIYFPNQPSKYIYMIADGRVKIGSYTEDGREIVKAILGRGEVFGELALTGEQKRGDFAQSMEDGTSVCPMSIDDMQELMAEDKELSFKIFKLIGFRIKRLERKLESMVFKDARSRIVDFIKELAEQRGKKVGFETMVRTRLTHKDIASLTGTSRQTVTTILNELKEQNLINFDRRQILVRDMEKLR